MGWKKTTALIAIPVAVGAYTIGMQRNAHPQIEDIVGTFPAGKHQMEIVEVTGAREWPGYRKHGWLEGRVTTEYPGRTIREVIQDRDENGRFDGNDALYTVIVDDDGTVAQPVSAVSFDAKNHYQLDPVTGKTTKTAIKKLSPGQQTTIAAKRSAADRVWQQGFKGYRDYKAAQQAKEDTRFAKQYFPGRH